LKAEMKRPAQAVAAVAGLFKVKMGVLIREGN
jgi:hypothetical protein